MALNYWLARITNSFYGNSKTRKQQRGRRRLTELRSRACQFIEGLEDRLLLSSVGVAVDGAHHQLVIFDATTGAQTGAVTIPNVDADTDVVVSPDGTRAYVAVNAERQIFVVDLTTNSLASGINPIPAVTNAQDLAITPDGQFLLTVGASATGGGTPIIVVDTTTRQVVENLNEGIGPTAVETTTAGDVLVTSFGSQTTRRYTLDAAGQLTFTGQTITGGGQNVVAASNGITALETDGHNSQLTSFLISGMSQVEAMTLPWGDFGVFTQSLAFSPDGTRFYAKTESRLLGYDYNPATGTIGSNFLNFALLSPPSGQAGVDEFDISADGSMIYLASGQFLLTLDSTTGTILNNIDVPGGNFVGVDVSPLIGTAEPGTVSGTKYNDLNSNGRRDAGESALANWVIYVDLDNDSNRDVEEPFTTTDANGYYSFTLADGTYTIREEQQPGWVQTGPIVPGTGANRLFAVRGNSGQTPTIYELNSAGGVINSFPAPGMVQVIGTQGLAVGSSSLFYMDGPYQGQYTLYELNPATGAVIDSDVLPFALEVAGMGYLNGKLYIESHPQNQITVFDPVTDSVVKNMYLGVDIIGGAAGAPDLDLLFETNANGEIFAINPTTGSVVNTFNTGLGPLFGGLAYYNGELIAANYTSNPVAYRISPTTGAVLGSFALDGVGTLSGLGGDGTTGSPGPHTVTVTTGLAKTGRDFGNRSILGTVTGTKFHDLDGDGARDAGEPGLSGWVIYADVDRDGSRDANEPFTTTAPDGTYEVTIPEGVYVLREEPQAGWVQTSPLPGLYATGNNGQSLVSIDPATGTATTIGTFGPNIISTYAGAFTPDGTFWTITNSFSSSLARLAKVDLATGVPTFVGDPNWTGSPVIALESDAAGNLVGADFNGNFYSVNKTTGQLTLIGRIGINGIKDLALDTAGTLWAVSGPNLYRLNRLTGAATQGPTITGTNSDVQSIMVDPLTGEFYGATYTSGAKLYKIDRSTGVATEVGTNLGVNFLNGGDFMPLSVNRGISIIVNAGQTLSGRDFGNERDEGVVIGLKFHDLDSDGVQDANEPGLSGWVIYADADDDGTRDANEPFTTTSVDGSYTLVAPSGSYTIREESQAGWVQTSPQPPVFATGSDGRTLFEIQPQAGTSSSVGSFGSAHTATYAGAFTPDGTFWTIINSFSSDLHQLAKVNLQTGAVTPAGSPNWSGSPIIALESDAAGNLFGASFSGLFFSISTTTGQLTFLGSSNVNGFRDLTFDVDGTLWGVTGQRLYRINPANGVSQPGPEITGADGAVQSIMVDPLTGIFYATTYSPNAKLYTIDLETGAATQVGAGLMLSFANGGDFMPLSANRGHRVTVSAGQTLSGRNFGNEVDQGTVTGTKFNDLDGDGEQDAGEPGLSGWVIYADLDNDSTRDANEPFTTTTATGSYSLTVASGSYVIREESQPGWAQTSPQPELFVTGSDGHVLFEIDPGTATAARVGSFGSQLHSSYAGAFTPDGTFWTVIHAFDSSRSQLAKVNLSTGAATPVGNPVWSGAPLIALESDAAGRLLGVAYDGAYYSINTTTGELTRLGSTGFFFAKDLTFDDAGVLWGVAGSNLFRINPLNGVAIQGPVITGVDGEVQSIMVDPLTGTFYAAAYSFGTTTQLYSVDTSTGVATALGTGMGYGQGNGGDFTPQAANRGHRVTVSAGHTAAGRDFGNEVDVSTISGAKFNDLDSDGVRDAGEPGLADWVIYADVDNDGLRDANEAFTTTAADGSYSLQVPSGSYTLREESQAGWVQTSPQPEYLVTGSDGQVLFKVNPVTGTSTRIGSFGTGVTATYAGAFTPDGTFWTIVKGYEPSQAQLASVNQSTGAVTLVGSPNWAGSPVFALESDAAGNLFAASVTGGFYLVNTSTGQLTLIGNMGQSNITDLTYDTNGILWAVTGNSLYRVNPLNGVASPGPVITGVNGFVQGIAVDPLTGTFYATTYQPDSQLYAIDLDTGVATAIGSGLGISLPNAGDFMPLSANRGISITVSPGQSISGRDFGNERDQGTVSGTKFNDLDGDGVLDAGEPGLAGWTIYADIDNDGTRDANEAFTTTAADGSYSLTVPSGSYTLREVAQAGWVQTSPQPGLFAAGDNGRTLFSIDPATGQSTRLGSFGTNIRTAYAGAFTPDGTFWTIIHSDNPSLSQLATVNLTTGAVTAVGTLNWSGAPVSALESDAAGNLFAGTMNGGFFSVNKTTGQLTVVGNMGIPNVSDFAFDNSGILWAVSSDRLYRVNPVTGAASIGPAIVGGVAGTSPNVRGIMVDPLTGVLYATNSNSAWIIYSINTATGEATAIGPDSQVNGLNGGDFVPLSANRGHAVTVSAGQSASGLNFGNRTSTFGSAAPVIGAFDTTVTYVENAVPVLLDANATVTDSDSTDFAGGVLTAALIVNSQPADQVSIRSLDLPAGPIKTVGNEVQYNGATFATFTGGTAGNVPLVITLGTGASTAAVQALIRNLVFRNTSDNPTNAQRVVQLQLTDGDGGSSVPVTKLINVTPVNDKPVIEDFTGSVDYVEGGLPVVISPIATVIDPDSFNLDLGKLVVKVALNAQATDRLGIRQVGTNPGEISWSGSNVTYGGVVIGTFAGTTTLAVTLNLNATPAAVQALLRNITFHRVAGPTQSNARTISAALTDGDGGTSVAVTTTVNVQSVNDLPVIGAFDTAITYVENALPALIDSNATVTDADLLDFAGGELTVDFTANGHEDDRLAIRPQGTAAGQIGIAGNDITYGNLLIGTFSGGTSLSAPLRIVFNSNALQAAVQAVVRNLTYHSVSQMPSTAPRTVRVQLTDGDGGSATPVTKTINVTSVNDAPLIGNFSGTATYTEDALPTVLNDFTSGITLSDADSANFDTGKLIVKVSVNLQSTDRISIRKEGTAAGQIDTSGTSVLYGGTIIGTFTSTSTLIVTLNASANAEAVQALLRNVTFHSISQAPSELPRTISATLSDGDGATSLAVTMTVQVTSTNDVPVLGAAGATVIYTEGGAATLIANKATVVDPDFNGGTLSVSLVDGMTTSDWLEIKNIGTGTGQIGVSGNTILYANVAIGTFSGGDAGNNLVITLTGSAATPAAVQALVRAITFRVAGGISANSTRTVRFSLTDNYGGVSNDLEKLISVRNVP